METMVLFMFLAVVVADGAVLVALGRARRLSPRTIAATVLAEVIGAALLAAGAVAYLFDGYAEEYGDGGLETLVLAVPLLIAGAVISTAAWLPVLRAS